MADSPYARHDANPARTARVRRTAAHVLEGMRALTAGRRRRQRWERAQRGPDDERDERPGTARLGNKWWHGVRYVRGRGNVNVARGIRNRGAAPLPHPRCRLVCADSIALGAGIGCRARRVPAYAEGAVVHARTVPTAPSSSSSSPLPALPVCACELTYSRAGITRRNVTRRARHSPPSQTRLEFGAFTQHQHPPGIESSGFGAEQKYAGLCGSNMRVRGFRSCRRGRRRR
ncbi:hypothetical protein B0H16DRAFT_1474406 [Mycena metata]|uniref:Uncharacterized protein n=1 Tax=Mycena metata TaxID=1033252 RepID=A0AAD7HGR5_9AGAR|nr:hypothetical protein B0H16DRAFT_1474406 [Mycena metata]